MYNKMPFNPKFKIGRDGKLIHKSGSQTGRKLAKKKKVSYRPSKNFTKQMNKYNNAFAEKRIMTMNNYLNGPGSGGYLQDIPCVGLATAGLTNDSLSVVVLQTGRQLTQLNAGINSTTGADIVKPMTDSPS